MCTLFKFTFTFRFFAVCITTNLAYAEPPQQVAIVNAFTGCNIRLINYRGLNIDFQVVKEPILLLRYLSHCQKRLLYPFELGSKYPVLRLHNYSTCHDSRKKNTNLPPDHKGISYVEQTLSESFQLQSKNKICEADIYLYPPTEHDSPQMYMEHKYWPSVLKNPTFVKLDTSYATEKWKEDFLNTVPMISLLICDSNADSICGNEDAVKKWVAGIFVELDIITLAVSVLIWEYPSLSLKILCPYCDPCDSVKFIHFHSNIIPTPSNGLESFLQENPQIFPDPHSVGVELLYSDLEFENFRNTRDVLKFIQNYSLEKYQLYLLNLRDQHLISLLLPNSANITFDEYGDVEWENVIVDVCSPTKVITSHPVFRPRIVRKGSKSRNLLPETRFVTYISQFKFVSCHKEQMHWTNQLKELISPFDVTTWSLILTTCFIVSWIVKLSRNSQRHMRNLSLANSSFAMFWSILDQPINLLTTAEKTPKPSFYCCMFSIPLSWMYFSTIYKGENVTRLTAEPPIVQFDTFKMLEENQFTTHSRRLNLKTFEDAQFFNISELVRLHKKHGSVTTHEALPVVSELWYYLMLSLRYSNFFEFSLLFLNDEISKQMWKYINNSAMLPDYGQEFDEKIATILNVHMTKCNKSAMILPKEELIPLQTALQQMKKPSFLGKDTILETFWGYKFKRYFPSKIVLGVRFLFDTGVIEWWQKYFEYSLVLKTNVHLNRLLPKTENQTSTAEHGGSQTAVVILSLIPGVGLLISTFVFIFVENICRKAQRQKFCLAEGGFKCGICGKEYSTQKTIKHHQRKIRKI